MSVLLTLGSRGMLQTASYRNSKDPNKTFVWATCGWASEPPFNPPSPTPSPTPTPTATPTATPTPLPPCSIQSQTVATSPANVTRTIIGVGESVVLTSADGTVWSNQGGTLVTTGGGATFTAGPTQGSAVVSVTGPNCSNNSISFTIIRPTGLLYQRFGNVSHTKGQPDIGMEARLYLQPDTVSFQNLFQGERDSTGAATGVWKCFNGTSHKPNPTPLQVLPDVPGFGSLVIKADDINSGTCPGYKSPFAASTEDDDITDYYTVSLTGFKYNFTLVLQSANLTAKGALSIKKGAATGSTTVKSTSSVY